MVGEGRGRDSSACRGATRGAILAAIDVAGEEDIGRDQLATWKGIATAIKEGGTTIERGAAPQARTPAAALVRAAGRASSA